MLKKLLGGAFGGFLQQGADIADRFIVSPEERAQFRQADKERTAALQLEIEATVQERYRAVRDIIVAEMKHGSAYAKNARPSVVYAGLAMFVGATVASGFGIEVEIPEQFTYTWGAICSAWVIARSTERVKANGWAGKVASVVTGNGQGTNVEL